MTKTKNIIFFTTIVIASFCVVITITTLLSKGNSSNTATPEYITSQDKSNIEPIPDDKSDKLESPQGGGAVSIVYSKIVGIDTANAKAHLIFQNPAKSTQDIVLQLIVKHKDKDEIISQSAKLNPGFKIVSLDLPQNINLKPGNYDGKFNVIYYNPKNDEKALLNTEIPIEIRVK